MDAVAKAPNDGCTLGLGFNGPIAHAPALQPRLSYRPMEDLAPVVLTTRQPNVLAVSMPEPPWMAQRVSHASSAIPAGSVGMGTASHLALELWAQRAGLVVAHAPFAGSPQAAQALAAGHIQVLFATAPALLSLEQAGRIRMVAVAARERFGLLPHLPTLAEAGWPAVESVTWNGLFAPAGTPTERLSAWARWVTAVLQQEGPRAALAREGLGAVGGTPAEFEVFLRQETAVWGRLIRERGLRADP
jgi:tripartite-type tricarboxylate transporter receptor subunit TctC